MCSFNFQALALAMRGLAMWMATLLGTASDGIVENFGPICCFLHDDHYRLYGIGCLFDEEHFFLCVCISTPVESDLASSQKYGSLF